MSTHAGEHRFVGRSVASAHADHSFADSEPAYVVPLADFEPFREAVALAEIRACADDIYRIRDDLETAHGRPLYLPFQFTTNRARLSLMSNYFAKFPTAMVETIFGRAATNEIQGRPPTGQRSVRSFLKPFVEKADTKYASVSGVAGTETVIDRARYARD